MAKINIFGNLQNSGVGSCRGFYRGKECIWRGNRFQANYVYLCRVNYLIYLQISFLEMYNFVCSLLPLTI